LDLLFICDTPPYPRTTPNANLIYYLAKVLDERRHTIDMLCFYDQPEDLAEIPRYEQFFRDVDLIPKPQLSVDKLRQRLRDKNQHFPKSSDGVWSGDMWRRMSHLLGTRRYDVVLFVGDILVYEYFPLARKMPNAIVVPQFRSADLAVWQSHAKGWGQRRLYRPEYQVMQDYERWMFVPFGKVIVSTPSQAKDLLQSAQIETITIPLGVDAEYHTPTGHDVAAPGLLFVGDFRHPVEHEAALKLCQHIFPPIQKAVPNVTLYLVGGHVSSELKAYASDKVIFTGQVPDIRPYFELASVYISPLNQAIGIQENILKALAMMTAVVGTTPSFDGLDLKADQEVAVADHNDELIRRTIRLLKDEQERLRLQVNGLHVIQQSYSWYQVASRYESLFSAMS
jgi:polysaccharide biosynthesis protein PslH